MEMIAELIQSKLSKRWNFRKNKKPHTVNKKWIRTPMPIYESRKKDYTCCMCLRRPNTYFSCRLAFSNWITFTVDYLNVWNQQITNHTTEIWSTFYIFWISAIFQIFGSRFLFLRSRKITRFYKISVKVCIKTHASAKMTSWWCIHLLR